MVGRTAFAAEGTAPKFINGLVVGENTSLTNRAENDNFGIIWYQCDVGWYQQCWKQPARFLRY